MAYRFLLEVPEALAGEANVAVEEAGDAQVILVRNSHGLGYDDPYVDLTVAAHSLRVIDTLYNWFDSLGASRPDLRIVLHGGDRLTLEAQDRGAMVAAIRRDQPWVERTLPKIGDHEEDRFTPGFTAGANLREGRAGAQIDAAGGNAPQTTATLGGSGTGVADDPSWVAPGAAAEPEGRRVALGALNHVAIRVLDMGKAERFYTEFFGMSLVGRARRGPRGGFQPVEDGYTWDRAVASGTEADVTYLRGGQVGLALHRAGRGARLEMISVLVHISVGVDATTFTTLRGEILMRSLETLATGETTMTFRDPFGLAWEISVQGTPALTGGNAGRQHLGVSR
ncbi:MAG: VOC family protein [Chloroflexota bacterium]|nr:VOC family protein [Chloroflexota bacterium]